MECGVIGLAKVLYALGFAYGPVLAGHMVGHEVEYELKAAGVNPLHK